MQSDRNNSGSVAETTGTSVERDLKVYIFDCGKIDGVTAAEFGFEEGEIATSMTTPCYLIEHPAGRLMWDTGEIPDADMKPDGALTSHRSFSASRRLQDQLAEIGITPADIEYLAFSHYHNDHVANANLFSDSTWLVQEVEHNVMFANEPDYAQNGPVSPNKNLFDKLETSKTVQIQNKDHDVFGDGRVIIKYTPGHTPGHQSLYLQLEETGPVILTGDLYHFYEEVSRPADFVNHASNPQVTRSRRDLEQFARDTGADLWIPHDIERGSTFKKSPEFYV